MKIAEDSLEQWALHAYLRQRSKHEPGGGGKPAARPGEPRVASSSAVRLSSVSGEVQQAVVRELLAFGVRSALRDRLQPPSFTPDPAANRLVIENPFAFLLAVIADQGIVAEKAWALPLALERALGTLSPQAVCDQPSVVRAVIKGPPALHRYVENVPRWLVAAGARVLRDYAGDAGAIWNDRPTARELQARLEAFEGIGQKKAAMGVEILARDLDVDIEALQGSDVAYDVHVRRVFLRTGLAERDELEHILEAGRRLHPQRPGAIDMPAWLVGRQWCHAGEPDCPACALTNVCPKYVERAAAVRGA